MTIAGLVLAPGASAGRDQAGLVAIEAAVLPLGIEVERIDFPYHLAGRRAPDPVKVLVQVLSDASQSLAARLHITQGSILVGGRSMGGRVASLAVAAGLPAAGLVLVSFPLHPPGRPEKLRTAHFPSLCVACLFVSGSKDPFASPAELLAATADIPGDVTRVVLERADHSLRRSDAEVGDAVRAWILDLGAAEPCA